MLSLNRRLGGTVSATCSLSLSLSLSLIDWREGGGEGVCTFALGERVSCPRELGVRFEVDG